MTDDDADAAWAYQQELEQRLQEDDEMRIGDMMPSKYLGKGDVQDKPLLLTIKGFQQVNLAKEGERPNMKWAMFFAEEDKPLIMNPTNLQLAAQALGTEETDQWVGRKIVAFNDPGVQYQGKLTGGVRLRAPRQNGAAQAPAPAQQPAGEDYDDSIPF